MRVLICGLIGAAVSSAAWLGLEYAMAQEFAWLAIAVGVITGMCVNAAAGAGAAASYGRAALAVLLTMLALICGPGAKAAIMRSISQVTTVVAKDNATEDAPAAEAQKTEGDAVAADAATPAERMPVDLRGETGLNFQKTKNTSDLDILWMGLAALSAYFFGKGSGKPAPIATDTSMPEGASPA